MCNQVGAGNGGGTEFRIGDGDTVGVGQGDMGREALGQLGVGEDGTSRHENTNFDVGELVIAYGFLC